MYTTTLTVNEVASGAEVFRRDAAVGRTLFDPSGRFMMYGYPLDPTTSLVALRAAEPEGVVEIYDTTSWALVAGGRVPADSLSGLSWASPTELISLGYSGVLQVVTIADGGLTVTQPLTGIDGRQWWASPDRQLLVIAHDSGRLRVLNGLGCSQPLTPLPTKDVGLSEVTNVAFSADSQRMVTVAGASITMWDVSEPGDMRRVQELGQLPIATYAGAGDEYAQIRATFFPAGNSLLLLINSNLIEVADFDPQAVCAAVSEADLERAEKVMKNRSACRDRVKAA